MFSSSGLIISFGLAAMITLLYVFANKNTEDKKEESIQMKPIVSMFSVLFIIVYMISILILDGNDNSAVYNNIKVGEPPF
jgi:ferric iron reductase protein FhuF